MNLIRQLFHVILILLFILTSTNLFSDDAVTGATDPEGDMSTWTRSDEKSNSNITTEKKETTTIKDETTTSDTTVSDRDNQDTITGASDDGVTMETLDESQQYYKFEAEGSEESTEIVDLSETVKDEKTVVTEIESKETTITVDKSDTSDSVTGATGKDTPDMYEVLEGKTDTMLVEEYRETMDSEIELVEETDYVTDIESMDRSDDVVVKEDDGSILTKEDTVTYATDEADMDTILVRKDLHDEDIKETTDTEETLIAELDVDTTTETDKETVVIESDKTEKDSTDSDDAYEQLLNDLEQKKRKDSDRVDEVNDDEFDRLVLIDNTKKESSMIIFDEVLNDMPPSLRTDFELDTQTVVDPWYHSVDFIPESWREFMTVSPRYSYTEEGVIVSGPESISRELGEVVFLEAYGLFKDGQISTAIQFFEKLIYYNYRSGDASYYASWCYYIKRNYTTAISYMMKTIGLLNEDDAEKSSEYYYHIGNIYYQIENYSGSLKYYKLVLGIDKTFYKVYNGVGLAYYRLGNIKSALEAWQTGKDGGDFNCQQNWAWLSGRLK